MNVEGKVAVVTGAASGLGLASAKALAQAGASIVAIDLDASRFARLQEAVPEARLLVQAASVADEAAVAQALDAAVARFGAIHIVVNCAGVADAAKTVSKGQPFPMATWDKVIAVNLTGTFNVIRLAAARMTGNEPNADGERGVIVNT